ncbi:hypothetical protein HD554DRAFT_2106541 [Boletus coccyginus]|nr:hypothetical protein HD554DRAFT_2106541 [Boletus coccyginus]
MDFVTMRTPGGSSLVRVICLYVQCHLWPHVVVAASSSCGWLAPHMRFSLKLVCKTHISPTYARSHTCTQGLRQPLAYVAPVFQNGKGVSRLRTKMLSTPCIPRHGAS